MEYLMLVLMVVGIGFLSIAETFYLGLIVIGILVYFGF